MKEKEKMMKKLLIFMLVLGLASMASAVPVIVGPAPGNTDYDFEVAIGSYITLTLEGTSAEASKDGGGEPYGINEGAVWVDYGAYSGQISGVVGPTTNMGGLGDIDEGYMDGTYATGGGPVFATGYAGDWSEATDVDVGDWFTFEVRPLSGAEYCDTYDLQVLDVDWNVVATYVVHVIPEPATIALLGLGGLFLRRRRK